MGDYIRREDAVDAVKHAWAKGIEPSQYIESLEPADAAPVVHSQWVLGGYDDMYYVCERCGHKQSEYYHKPTAKYCSNCGAKMDGEEDNDQ